MTYRLSFVKKISLVVALLFLLGSKPAFGESSGNYRFTVTDGGAVVTAYLGEGLADIAVPDTMGGVPVVSIGIGAFWGNKDIRAVQLPATVTQLDRNAFADCERLATLHAVGVTSIADYALYGCDSLATLTVNPDLTSVGKSALEGAQPAISLEIGRSIDDLLRVHKTLAEHGSVSLGNVGSIEVTDELLAFKSSVDRLLANAEPVSVEALWADDAVTVTNPDGSTATMNFVEFSKQLHSTGLYSILDTGSKTRLKLRMDAVLEALLADAKRM